MDEDGEAPQEPFEDLPDDGGGDAPDVLLDVPTLHVDEIDLEVDDLRARVSLSAEVLDVLKINVGADVDLARVELDLKGVEARARLTVRLGRVAEMVERVLAAVENNPELLQHVVGGVASAASEVGSSAGRAVEQAGRGADHAIEGVARGAGESGRSVVRRATEDAERAGDELGRRPRRRERRSD